MNWYGVCHYQIMLKLYLKSLIVLSGVLLTAKPAQAVGIYLGPLAVGMAERECVTAQTKRLSVTRSCPAILRERAAGRPGTAVTTGRDWWAVPVSGTAARNKPTSQQ